MSLICGIRQRGDVTILDLSGRLSLVKRLPLAREATSCSAYLREMGTVPLLTREGGLVGGSLDEMKRKYEAQRDKEFAAHVCAKHLRATSPKPE